MGLTGDFQKLGTLINEMRRFSKTAIPAATEAAKDAIRDNYTAGVVGQKDPDGTPWKPRKSGKGGPLLPLLAHHTLTSTTGRVTLRPTARWWSYHQAGANSMHPRHVVPYGNSRWDNDIAERCMKAIEEEMPRGD